jgi:protein CLEC16A
VSGDKDDSRCLQVTVHRPTSITGGPAASARPAPRPLLAARFIFDDHIRCMAARQRLVKGRLRARQRKMQMIARLLEMPASVVDVAYRPAPLSNFRRAAAASTAVTAASPGIPGQARLWH